ncbi:hypothetical protein C8R46DRAFT_1042558 [Mycena filopes]|nr:hypothetical protein C8R46DRAFT_1042558 [Mycena filopes]
MSSNTTQVTRDTFIATQPPTLRLTLLTPGTSVYIQNQQGQYLTRIGEQHVGFSKSTPDVYCKFKVAQVGNTEYVSLTADNGLALAVDYGAGFLMWLQYLYPQVSFTTEPVGYDGQVYLIGHDLNQPAQGPWTVTGENGNGAISTVVNPTQFNGLWIVEA